MIANRVGSAVEKADLLTACTVLFGNITKEFSWAVCTSKSFIFVRARKAALASLEVIPRCLIHGQFSALSL